MTADVVLVAIAGAIFILGCIVLAIKFPLPTAFQFFVFRTVLALSAAAGAAAIPGFLSISTDLPGLAIRAGGALAVFVLVYRLNPAALIALEVSEQDVHSIVETLRSIETAVNAVFKGLKSGADQQSRRARFSEYLERIADAIDSVITSASNREDALALRRACGMLDQYLWDFSQYWYEDIPSEVRQRIQRSLHEAIGLPAGIVLHENWPTEIRKNSTALSEISGRFRAMSQAAKV